MNKYCFGITFYDQLQSSINVTADRNLMKQIHHTCPLLVDCNLDQFRIKCHTRQHDWVPRTEVLGLMNPNCLLGDAT